MQQLSLINAHTSVMLDPALNQSQIDIVDLMIRTMPNETVVAAFDYATAVTLHSDNAPLNALGNPVAAYFIRFSKMAQFTKNPTCACCGVSGSVWVTTEPLIGANAKRSMAAIGVKNGKIVRLTCDHILPRAMGGTDMVDNIQTMCNDCNVKKASMLSLEDVRLIQQDRRRHAKHWVNDQWLDLALQLVERYHLAGGKAPAEMKSAVEHVIVAYKQNQTQSVVDKSIRDMRFVLHPKGYAYAKMMYDQEIATNKTKQKKAQQERKRRKEAEDHPNGHMVYWMKYWVRRFGHWLIRTAT